MAFEEAAHSSKRLSTSEMQKRGITLRNLIVVNGFKHSIMIFMVSLDTVK